MRIRGKEKVPALLESAAPLIYEAESGLLIPPAPYEQAFTSLEIGCGRGTFITTLAQMHPDRWFIAIDKYTPIVARAAMLAMEMGLKNIRVIDMDVEQILTVLGTQSVDRIYLNFSDPWPRRRNHIKRLTHPRFIPLYLDVLREGGRLQMKTDNRELFDYSLKTLELGFTMLNVHYDLPVNASVGEQTDGAFTEAFVQTEYEQKFRALGQPIHYLLATRR